MTCSFYYMKALWVFVFMVPAAEAALRGASGEDPFLRGLERALTRDEEMPEAVRERVEPLVELMRPVYQALPRSEDGYLDASTTRYLLHRYFIDRRGWFVPTSGRDQAADETLPLLLLGAGKISDAFRNRLATRGLGLSEVATLAATLESLTNIETAGRLRAAFRLLGLTPDKDHIGEAEVKKIIDVYLPMYSIGMDYGNVTLGDIREVQADIYNPIPRWDQYQMWTRELRAEVLAKNPQMRYSFEGLYQVFLLLQDRYARWADTECLSVKATLKDFAVPGTGRVPLDTFYTVNLPGGWQSDEPVEELREMGALDETDPSQPSIVVPNYFDTPANCEDPSKFYSVCCISECEALMKHLEHELGSPDAPPQRIIDIVEKLPSAAVDAPRKLPEHLTQRLHTIAELHGGHAKLHGRLFRQWMHHAYPGECPFPFLATDKVEAPTIDQASLNIATAEELPWFADDEDYLTCQGPPKEGSSPRASFRSGDFALLIGGACLTFKLVQMFMSVAREHLRSGQSKKTDLPY